MPGKVRVIPANTNEPMKHVVIYARVSSNTVDQLESLKAQISGLTKFVSGHNNWKLVDIHIDIASAKKDSSRPAFHQMIEECKAGLTDIVVVKSISRLGRDTVEVLDAINTLRESQVRIIFKQEELDTLTVGSSLLISTIEACTQAENETRSANIKWGIKQRASNGSLGFYRRKCYGYDKDENGNLIINKEQVEVVKLIFDLYLGGKSILGIVEELKDRNIKSPTGKDDWPKRSVEKVLSNEKYIGISAVNVGGEEGQIYKLNNSHPSIIPKEMFDTVQEEKMKRSNIVADENGIHRNTTKYSSKNKNRVLT
ncbi:recombinase family protein [uncultured Ruminococcus sp.]|uniref:recombinase family protein n=1 Tax=uncultured Ruminococcus sp. TaxID=165186 RepID=UPI002593A53F|nr:recombinase family protein [uncultured Ruminococcus sp.]